jgi:hypothetical protein
MGHLRLTKYVHEDHNQTSAVEVMAGDKWLKRLQTELEANILEAVKN